MFETVLTDILEMSSKKKDQIPIFKLFSFFIEFTVQIMNIWINTYINKYQANKMKYVLKSFLFAKWLLTFL
jgi:hypothetical protein